MNRNFTEYRRKDYFTPRSMKEAYGSDPILYENNDLRMTRGMWMDLTALVALIAVVVLAVIKWGH